MMWIISLFLLAFTVDLGLCCSCRPEPTHIQNAYCSSSLVIRGKAIKRPESRNIELTTFPYPLELPVTTVPDPDPWDMIKIFHVDVIEVFKAPTDANIKTGDVIEAVTNAHENLCGGYLPLNKELLITGGVNEQGQMTFGHCSYLKPYNVLSNFQLESLQGGYSCDCRVATWYRNNPARGCRINDSECLHKYGRCVLEYNKCVWVVDPEASCYYTTTSPSPRTTPPQPPRTTPPQPPRTTPPQSPRTTPHQSPRTTPHQSPRTTPPQPPRTTPPQPPRTTPPQSPRTTPPQ